MNQKPCREGGGKEPAFHISEHQIQFMKNPEDIFMF